MFERFTERAREAVVLAQEEARTLRHDHIGTEHILLGLGRENEGVAARVLLDFDADSEKIRNEVIRMLSGPGSRQVMRVQTSRRTVAEVWLDGLGPLLSQLAREIRDKLGREPDDGDLLLVLACARDTLPGRALAELGIDLDVLWGTIERARAQVCDAEEQATRTREQLARQIRACSSPRQGRSPRSSSRERRGCATRSASSWNSRSLRAP